MSLLWPFGSDDDSQPETDNDSDDLPENVWREGRYLYRHTGPEPPESSRTGYIRAWRGWKYSWRGGQVVLTSTYKDNEWPSPRMEADEPPPARKREKKRVSEYTDHSWRSAGVAWGPGLYALKPLECSRLFKSHSVVGEVDLFGKVVEHERGYRAEKAVIRKLYVVPTKTKSTPLGRYSIITASGNIENGLVSALEDRYHCEVNVALGRKMAEFWKQERSRLAEKEEGDERTEFDKDADLTPQMIRKIVREELNQWTSESQSASSTLSRQKSMLRRIQRRHKENLKRSPSLLSGLFGNL